MSNYDLSKILPHNPPMILIDDILNYDLTQKTLTAIVKITEDKLFFDKSKNGISSLVGIELWHKQLVVMPILEIIANLQNSVFCLVQDFLIMHLMFLKTEKTTK